MKLSEIVDILDARVICGEEMLDQDVEFGFASDLMSDVLTLDTDNMLLITGLSNLQTMRTVEMADVSQILFVRNKQVNADMVKIARDNDILVMTTSRSMFRSIGALHEAGLKPIY